MLHSCSWKGTCEIGGQMMLRGVMLMPVAH